MGKRKSMSEKLMPVVTNPGHFSVGARRVVADASAVALRFFSVAFASPTLV